LHLRAVSILFQRISTFTTKTHTLSGFVGESPPSFPCFLIHSTFKTPPWFGLKKKLIPSRPSDLNERETLERSTILSTRLSPTSTVRWHHQLPKAPPAADSWEVPAIQVFGHPNGLVRAALLGRSEAGRSRVSRTSSPRDPIFRISCKSKSSFGRIGGCHY
jgi:hypothetical protein